MVAGGTSAVDTAIFVLAVRNVIRNIASNILWVNGILDCLSHQCSLRRISSQNGETRGQILQKSRYSGRFLKFNKFDSS